MELMSKCTIVWLFIAIAVAFIQSAVFKCWMDSGNSVIEFQCKDKEAVGTKCPVVCSALNTDCYLYHASKDLVRVTETEDQKIVLKHKDIPMLNKEYTQSLLPVDEEPPEVFQDMLQGLLAFELNGRDNLDILSLLWPWHNSSSIITGQNSQLLEQIVRFAHNDEYKLMQLYSDLQLFPRVLGTCGDIYVVEHMTLLLDRPLLDLFPALTDTCHVTRSARRILHYLLHLSSVLPLHLCDLQWGHFGADSAGRVRFVDLDAAFSAEKMAATQRETVCSTDEDCDFFDCRGTCDVAQGRCLGGVSDNVSNLCRQLVWARAPLLGAQRRLGLLAAVLSEQQAELLERCARSRTAEHAQQVAEVLEELERRTCAEPEWETRDTDTDEF